MRSFTWFLLICIAAFAWGARDWLRYQWNEMSAGERKWWAAGLSIFFLATFAHLLKPFFF